MPRIPRLILQADNVCYHIIARGNQKQNIFLEDRDRDQYMSILRHYKKKYRFWLYSFCLMANHVHLILEPDNLQGSISQIMHGVNLVYCKWFNEKYAKNGHLWQGRFKSYIVQKNEYLINCVNYVELNPVRAGLIKNPLDYMWSSHKYRVLGIENGLLNIPKLEAMLT